jgi:hypothetical protein
MTTIKSERHRLSDAIEQASPQIKNLAKLLADAEAFAKPNGTIGPDTYDALIDSRDALTDVIKAIYELTSVRAGESGGFVNGINSGAGTCRIISDGPNGYSIINLADYEPEFDELFIDTEEA